MWKMAIIGTLAFSLTIVPLHARCQEFEIEQLLLDWQKLSYLKTILSDLYKGYEVLSKGYDAIRDVSKGNFNLHKAFLDALLLVSPAVRNDPHIAAILSKQSDLIAEYKSAFSRFNRDPHFSSNELVYIGAVYSKLVASSLEDIQQLTNLLTQNVYRMSDKERLEGVDAIYENTNGRLEFLRRFNTSTTELAVGRATTENDIGTLKNLYGL